MSASPSGQLSVPRAVKASEFAVRDLGEPNRVALSSINVLQDYQSQLLAQIVIPVDRPRKGFASLIECSRHQR
jgi:hypothetical protein